MFKEQKGITLIALVVTIIVLLILAGVTIAMLTGQNGILTNAQKARETTSQAEAEEKINMTLNAIKTEIFVQQVDDKSYSGLVDGEREEDPDTLQTRITEIMKLDLGNGTELATTTNEGLSADEYYSYNLTGSTLTIYYYSTTDNFKTSGSINLSSTTSAVTITPATSSQLEAL